MSDQLSVDVPGIRAIAREMADAAEVLTQAAAAMSDLGFDASAAGAHYSDLGSRIAAGSLRIGRAIGCWRDALEEFESALSSNMDAYQMHDDATARAIGTHR